MTTPHLLSAAPVRAARWSARHPWRAIAAWACFVVAAVALAVLVPTVEADDADYRLGESGRAAQLVTEAGLDQPDTENVLLTARSGELRQDDRAGAEVAEAAADEVRTAALGVAGVDAVSAPLWSPDGTALLVSVQLARDGDVDLAGLRAVTAAAQDAHPDLLVRQAGDRSLDDAVDTRVGDDLSSAEVTSLPITLVLMLLAFGALVAAGLPVLLAASSVAATIGVLAPISHLVHVEGTVGSMIVLIGMAVGVDYSLFFLKREREERARGHATLDAVEIAARTSGHSILVSGGAVVATMTGLFLTGTVTFSSLAVGSIIVVAVAVLGSITVLPALLVVLGSWVDRPRVPLVGRLRRRLPGGISERVLAPVLRHPVVALVASGVVVLALAAPALGLRVHETSLDSLPADIAEVATLQDVVAAYPAEGSPATVVVHAAAAERAAVSSALVALGRTAAATGDFVDTGAQPEVSPDGATTVLRLATTYDDSDPRLTDALRELRSTLVPAALAGQDVEAVVGGPAAESLDVADRMGGRLPLVVVWVLLLTFVMMLVTFRSVVVAALSTLLNLGSVGVSFGFLALVFQHGWGTGLLGIETPGYVVDWLPLFVLVVLVGLSMDYHVFVVSRIREHVQAGMTTREAVRRGIGETAGVVSSAAAVMVSVFSIFATLSLLEMKMLGVGLAAAILLDATVVRLVMLPATLALLGERAWWPVRPVPAAAPPAVETARAALAGIGAGR